MKNGYQTSFLKEVYGKARVKRQKKEKITSAIHMFLTRQPSITSNSRPRCQSPSRNKTIIFEENLNLESEETIKVNHYEKRNINGNCIIKDSGVFTFNAG